MTTNMNNLRSLPLFVLASAFLCTAAALAQQAAPAVRIVDKIDESNLVTLKGNTPPAANAKNDRGAVSPSFALPDLTLVLSRSPERQAAFDAFVSSQYDSSSPNYHQWLTPAQIGARFGPAQADIATVSGWLASHGFTVNRVTPDGMTIHFNGTAAEVESAFHTQIHHLSVNGVMRYANMSDPQIPAALAPVVVGVKALHNFLPQPQHKLGGKVQFNEQMGKWQQITNSTTSSGLTSSPASVGTLNTGSGATLGAHPMFGINGNAGTQNASLEEDVAPYDFATIYNVLPLWNNHIDGTGQTIAIIGTSFICLNSTSPCTQNDVAAFRSEFGLSTNFPSAPAPIEIDTGSYFSTGTTATVCNSTSSSAYCGIGDLEENTLDVEESGAVAPGAQIALVATGQSSSCNATTGAGCVDTLYDSAAYVVDNHGNSSYPEIANASILSASYGMCELGNGTSGNVAYYILWQEAAAEGISVFVSSGDSGSAGCDDNQDTIYGNPYVAQYGLSVNGIASTPFNTAVGGTDFSWCQPYYTLSGTAINFQGCPTSSTSQGTPAYWNTSNNATTGASAAGYVPEIPWNDTCENPIWAKFLETLLSTTGADSSLGVAGPTTPEGTCNLIYNDWNQIYQFFNTNFGITENLAPFVDTVGGSGGASGCVVNSTSTTLGSCTTNATSAPNGSGSIALTNDGWQKPTWQSGITGIPSDGVRDLPDVSFFSGNGALDSATLICVSLVGSCTLSSTTQNTAQEVGGTSVATPQMAGVMALINQHAGAAQGLPNAELYDLAARQNYSSCSSESVTTSSSCYFNDIDNGPSGYSNAQTIAMPCNLTGTAEGGSNGSTSPGAASPNCAKLTTGDTIGTLVSSGATPGYNSATGFDLATGLGSLNVANVVNAWPTGAFTPTFALSATSITVGPGETTANTSTITVAPSDGFTGTVSFTCAVTSTPANATSPVTCPSTITSATVTGSAEATTTIAVGSTSTTTQGAYVITVTGTSGTIIQTTPVTVTVAPTYTVSASSPSGSISPGNTATSTINVSSRNGYSGSITLTCAPASGNPTNQSGDAPTCNITSGSPITLSATTTSGTATATVSNIVAATAALVYPRFGKGKGWLGAGSGAVLALVFLFGIPKRRRSWRSMFGIVVAMVGLGILTSCGGGGGGGGGSSKPGTTAGTYTFIVTGTGTPAISPAPTATFTVTVVQ